MLNNTKSGVSTKSLKHRLIFFSVSAQNEALKGGKSANGTDDAHSGTTSQTSQRRSVTVWLERADRINARLRKITGDDARQYLRRIVEGFLGNRDKDAVYEQIVAVGKLQKSVCSYENKVLTLAGLGPEHDKLMEVIRAVDDVVRWLEEVLCLAMVDAAEVEVKYNLCQFSFQ